jgi:hypothetical protein
LELGLPAAGTVQGPPRITRRAVLGILVLLAVTFVAASSCQQAQVRLTKEQAITAAQPRAGFDPEQTQVRLVRQGLTGRPYWAVSFSIPRAGGDGYERITTVRVDANSGTIAAVNRERP